MALKAAGYQPRTEGEAAVVDLMADLMHYGLAKGYCLADIERLAKGHWAYEQMHPRGGGPL